MGWKSFRPFSYIINSCIHDTKPDYNADSFRAGKRAGHALPIATNGQGKVLAQQAYR